jgi:pimeloyl-ACP methyl ester carboxylesterase
VSTPRLEALLHDPERQSTYERWGASGRPVLLLNRPERDRSAWWPVAADLGGDHAVMVLDLPEGHGPEVLAEDLAHLVLQLGTRAPVLVGHGSAALVASVFAARYLAHAVVNVEQRLDPAANEPALTPTLREVTEAPKPLACPYLSVFAAAPEPAYAEWLGARIPKSRCESYGTAGEFPHLAEPARFAADVRGLTA